MDLSEKGQRRELGQGQRRGSSRLIPGCKLGFRARETALDGNLTG